eukprot:gene54387-62401_t
MGEIALLSFLVQHSLDEWGPVLRDAGVMTLAGLMHAAAADELPAAVPPSVRNTIAT